MANASETQWREYQLGNTQKIQKALKKIGKKVGCYHPYKVKGFGCQKFFSDNWSCGFPTSEKGGVPTKSCPVGLRTVHLSPYSA